MFRHQADSWIVEAVRISNCNTKSIFVNEDFILCWSIVQVAIIFVESRNHRKKRKYVEQETGNSVNSNCYDPIRWPLCSNSFLILLEVPDAIENRSKQWWESTFVTKHFNVPLRKWLNGFWPSDASFHIVSSDIYYLQFSWIRLCPVLHETFILTETKK